MNLLLHRNQYFEEHAPGGGLADADSETLGGIRDAARETGVRVRWLCIGDALSHRHVLRWGTDLAGVVLAGFATGESRHSFP